MKPMTDDNRERPDDDDDASEGEFEVSDEVERSYRAVKGAMGPKQRRAAMMALAEMFAGTHDPTDYTATDDWHAYIEEYEEARLRFNQAGMRLGRLLTHILDAHFGEEPPQDTTPSPKRSLN